MAQVSVRINGYAYTVGCEDGQEEHLAAMAAEVERRIDSIKQLGGQSGEARLLVLAALLMADELHDTQAELEAARQAPPAPPPAPAPVPAANPRLTRRIARLAEQAEEIATRLDRP
jgi:cell division protein ZapA